MHPLDQIRRNSARVTEEIRAARPARSVGDFSRETLMGARFRPGDRVRDLVSGQGGTVVNTRFVQAIFPPSDGPGS